MNSSTSRFKDLPPFRQKHILRTAGLEALDIERKNQVKKKQTHEAEIAQSLFRMAVLETGTDEELKELVTHGTLLELILFTIGYAKSTRARANQSKGAQKAINEKEVKQRILFDWLDKNISKYEGRLNECALAALKIKGLDRKFSAIRKQITEYRKLKELADKN
jgi:ppGpp synthetase/RelA/SpoT-type nucleotidyltranferase